MENNEDLLLDLDFVKMLKYLCLDFTLYKCSKATLNCYFFKSKTVSFIETGSYGFEKKTNAYDSSNKLMYIKVKHFNKNAFQQKENQKVPLAAS